MDENNNFLCCTFVLSKDKNLWQSETLLIGKLKVGKLSRARHPPQQLAQLRPRGDDLRGSPMASSAGGSPHSLTPPRLSAQPRVSTESDVFCRSPIGLVCSGGTATPHPPYSARPQQSSPSSAVVLRGHIHRAKRPLRPSCGLICGSTSPNKAFSIEATHSIHGRPVTLFAAAISAPIPLLLLTALSATTYPTAIRTDFSTEAMTKRPSCGCVLSGGRRSLFPPWSRPRRDATWSSARPHPLRRCPPSAIRWSRPHRRPPTFSTPWQPRTRQHPPWSSTRTCPQRR